ncbi:MAG: chemotaxis protein CheA [Sphingomonadales bacterium]|nr:chemotaxis protein CheA [Sphingomonadales bacterium]MBD3774366.1 chemotaxis protein CheA [Paracoccaceae bacterium]
MDELLAEFIAETREMLEASQAEIVSWEQEPGDRARLDAIFRFVHTVKGNCGFFDLPRLAKLSHAAESALAEVRAGRRSADSRLVTAVLAVIDRIVAMVDAIEAGEDFPEGGDELLMNALEPGQDDGGESAALHAQAASERKTGSKSDGPRSIRLPVELLDRVMSGVSDMVLARNELARRMREYGVEPTIDGPFERLSAVLDDVRDGITRMRMQRIEHLFNAFPRLVRDLSAELGKQVLIDMEGGEVEIDREMIEVIRDPLTHIIRNALDHGIESPAQRIAAGKREIGLLNIAARQAGNHIIIAVSDDGRGIDGQRLVEKAIASGIATAEECAGMSEDERYALVFEPGLSTAREVTAISGRGVGMDVVRANIERVGGTISVSCTAGQGTRILLSLPLTLSIIPSLTVECGGERYAIPRSYVEEIVHARAGTTELVQVGDAWLATIRGERLRCIALADVLAVDGSTAMERAALVLIRLAGGDLFAMAVDRVLDHEELVIKPLAPRVMATGIYAGTTLLDDGSPVLMLDMAGIARSQKLLSDVQRRVRRTAQQNDDAREEAEAVPMLLFTALDGQRRAVRMDVVRRIDKVAREAISLAGHGARVVIDEALLSLAGVTGGSLPDGRVTLLRLADGRGEMAYAVREILDTASMTSGIMPADAAGEIEGVTLIDGKAVEVIDCHWIFASEAHAPRQLAPATCRLPDDDPWTRSILRPLVESAGYRILGDSDKGEPDVVIVSEGSEAPTGAATLIRMVGDPAAASATGDIYRYDRSALMAALSAARARRIA